MNRKERVEQVIEAVGGWQAVEAVPHRFGGMEFQFEGKEVGHIHRSGMVDIPYTKRLRIQLVGEAHTGLHHLLPETGWTTFYICSEADAERAIWLFRISLLQKQWRAYRYDVEKQDVVRQQFEAAGVSDWPSMKT